MALSQPYKGLPNSIEPTAHLGSDWADPYATTATGTKVYDSANYAKVQEPANPAYYTATGAHEYKIQTDNNGQAAAFPSSVNGDTTAIYRGSQTRQPIKMSYGYNDGVAT